MNPHFFTAPFWVRPWACCLPPLIICERGGSGFYRFRGFSGGGAAHKNIEAPQSMDGAMLESTFQVTSHKSLEAPNP